MPGMRSSAATKCISLVPGLEKQTSTPPLSSVFTRLSAPFTAGFPSQRGRSQRRKVRGTGRLGKHGGAAGCAGARGAGRASFRTMIRIIILGFLAGFVSVLVFHQGTAFLLYAFGNDIPAVVGFFGRTTRPST